MDNTFNIPFTANKIIDEIYNCDGNCSPSHPAIHIENALIKFYKAGRVSAFEEVVEFTEFFGGENLSGVTAFLKVKAEE